MNLGKCTKEDMDNEFVTATMKLIDGNPILSNEHLDQQLIEASMDPETLELQRKARRDRIARDAKEHLEKFESMSQEEKQSAIHDGDLDHYSDENQTKRENLFNDFCSLIYLYIILFFL